LGEVGHREVCLEHKPEGGSAMWKSWKAGLLPSQPAARQETQRTAERTAC
jgi:hypothetical protein